MPKRILLPLLLVTLLGACGKKEEPKPTVAPSTPAPQAAPTPAPPPAAASAPAAGGDLAKGEDVYKKTCAMCHAAGVAGAPKFGVKAEWEARIAQGNAVLYDHAIKGFTGAKGTMPPKGGNAALSDDDVKAGADYMVSQAK